MVVGKLGNIGRKPNVSATTFPSLPMQGRLTLCTFRKMANIGDFEWKTILSLAHTGLINPVIIIK